MQDVGIHVNGITPKPNWSLSFIHSFTQEEIGFRLDSLYNYDTFNDRCKKKLMDNDRQSDDVAELDEHMWSVVTEYIEECRKFIFDTCKEEGVNECEAYFLSLKFVWSALRKFRNKFYRELDNREDYDATPLKIAINFLMFRVKQMMAPESYKFSATAADGRLGQFRKSVAWAAAEYLAEETGVIFHAKVTL